MNFAFARYEGATAVSIPLCHGLPCMRRSCPAERGNAAQVNAISKYMHVHTWVIVRESKKYWYERTLLQPAKRQDAMDRIVRTGLQ